MSVIDNALKAAQREKQRKYGNMPPVLVPLRSSPYRSSSAGSRIVILGVGLGVFAATALGVWVMKERPEVGPLPAPIILGDAPTDTKVRPDSSATRVAVRQPIATDSTTEAEAPIRQPAAKSGSVDKPAPPMRSARAVPSSESGLRISVEPARDDAARLFAAAVAAQRDGNVAYARSAYERVLTLVPSDVDAMNNLAILHLANREQESAERLLRRALALAPRNAGLWSNLGTVLRERGQSADAIASFQRALALDPQNLSARISLAQQFLAIGSLAQSREILERVLSENPAIPEAQYALGQVLDQQGDYSGAIRAYSAFIRVAPPRLSSYATAVRRRIDELSAKAR